MSTKHKLLAALISCLAFVALGVSGYLTYATWSQSTVAGCSGGTVVDCDVVLQSPWSKWFGLPVSLFGTLVYAGILGGLWPAALSRGRVLIAGLLALVLLAAGAGTWFIGLQVVVLKHYCMYCLAVHTCGIVVAGLTLLLIHSLDDTDNVGQMQALLGVVSAPGEQAGPVLGVQQLLVALGVAAFGLGGLVGGQVFFAPPSMEIIEVQPLPESVIEPAEELATAELADDESTGNQSTADMAQQEAAEPLATAQPRVRAQRRIVRFSSLKEPFDISQLPVLGNPAAEHILVEMLDYTCPHCRELHPYIQKVLARYGDQLGIVVFHIPLSRKCNPVVHIEQVSHANGCDYARLAYGVWKLAPERFAEYHDWLMEGEKGPAAYLARNKAYEIAGEQILLDKSIEVEANRLIAEHSAEMNRLQTGLPLVIFAGGMVKGKPESEESWYKLLEERIGVKPQVGMTNDQ